MKLLASLLSLSTAALYVTRRRHIRAFQRLRHKPIQAKKFEQGQWGSTHDKPLVVFLGDSRAVAWSAPSNSKFVFENRGVNGESAAQVLHRLEQDVVLLRPKITILQVGVNDLNHIGVFNSAERNDMIRSVNQTIALICQQLTDAGSHVILTTIFPCGKPGLQDRLWGSAETTRAIKAVNAYIDSLASSNITILDTVPILCSDGTKVDKRFAADYLHLNKTGYTELNKHLSKLLTHSQFTVHN